MPTPVDPSTEVNLVHLTITDDDAHRIMRTLYDSPTHATGAIPPSARLFTIREIAEIISKSYHTTRNMALRGDFGEILRSDARDENGEYLHTVAYVQRDGLLAYLNQETEKHIERATALRVAHDQLCGIIDNNAAHLREYHTQTEARVERIQIDDDDEIDVTDERANLAQAFQNIADAFTDLTQSFNAMYDEMHTLTENDRGTLHAMELRDLEMMRGINLANNLLNRNLAATDSTAPSLRPLTLSQPPLRELAELNTAPFSASATPIAANQSTTSELTLDFGAHAEILHPMRFSTHRVSVSGDGALNWPAHEHFVALQYVTDPERRVGRILWQAF